MSFVAVCSGEVRNYESPNDPDPKSPTKFKLGVIEHRVRLYIDDLTTEFEISSKNPKDSAKATMRVSLRGYNLVRFGLKGFENFKDKNGEDIGFSEDRIPVDGKSYTVVSEKVMTLLPYALISELAQQLDKQNTMSDEERGNLDSTSQSAD